MILRSANRLFVIQGFNGTGVDQIASESEVTKRTLYKHFGSKEGLIQEVLLTHHAEMMANIRANVDEISGDTRERLLACFKLYRDWFSSTTFHGCIFIKTLNEFSACSSGLGKLAQDAKTDMRNFIESIAKEGGAKNAAKLALGLQILLEGSIILAHSGEGPSVIDTSWSIGEMLIDKYL